MKTPEELQLQAEQLVDLKPLSRFISAVTALHARMEVLKNHSKEMVYTIDSIMNVGLDWRGHHNVLTLHLNLLSWIHQGHLLPPDLVAEQVPDLIVLAKEMIAATEALLGTVYMGHVLAEDANRRLGGPQLASVAPFPEVKRDNTCTAPDEPDG